MRIVFLLLITLVGWVTAQTSGQLRLVRNGITHGTLTSGRLEVYYSGQWGTVCNDLWDSTNTRVACRQLGFLGFDTSWTNSSAGGFGSTTGTIWLDNVNCFGTESRLTSCSRNTFGVHNCGHSDDVAINCSCSSTQFHCTSGECIPTFARCGGIRTCSDGSDERNCISCRTGAFWCSNLQCIRSFYRCDGTRDCTDGSDEIGCGPASGDLRLVRNGLTSTSYTSGRLEVYYSGRWGTVCNDFWSSTNTRVACRQLGFSSSSTSWTTSSAGGFGSTTGEIWLDNVRCSGTESRLTSCSRNSYGSHNCVHSEDVAIDCSATTTAPSSGDLRLVRNGITSTSYTSGRLEVYYSGQWGTVCNDYWSSTNSRIACRQLGFAGAASPTSYRTSYAAGFGTGSGRIWLDNVRCRGTESRLTSCRRNSYGAHNCFHFEDVAIYCSTTSSSSGTSSSGNTLGTAVGASVASFVLFVIIPIIICIVVGCRVSSRRRRTTVTTAPRPVSSTTTVVIATSKQQSAQRDAYPAAGTDVMKAQPPPYEMATYPPQPAYPYPPQEVYPPPPQAAYPYPPQEMYPPPPQNVYS